MHLSGVRLVCPSLGYSSSLLLWPDRQEISIDCYSNGGRMRTVTRCQRTYLVLLNTNLFLE